MRTLAQSTPLEEQQNLFRTEQQPPFRSLHQQTNKNVEDEAECVKLLEKIVLLQPQLSRKADQLLQQVQEKEYGKGMGYFNSKNLLMLEYLIQLQFYQLFKINGEDLTSGEGLELYKRLAYLKTLMTKLSPVEKKLQYQKNKLLKYSDVIDVKADLKKNEELNENEDESVENADQSEENSENDEGEEVADKIEEDSDEEDALMYQPRPQALMNAKQKKKKQEEQDGKYIAPKISAVLSKQDKLKRKQELQEQRRKAFLVRKYRGDLQDDEQAREVGVGSELAEKIKRKQKERTTVEQDNFMRLPETKKEKMWKKSLIRRAERSNPLYDELRDIETIRQIFSQRKDETKVVQKTLKRSKDGHKPKGGSKKRKME